MEIKYVQLADLKPVDKFLLSFPLKPELYYDLWEKFAHCPLIIVNRAGEILFGIDFYRLLTARLIPNTHVLQMDIPDKEALFLNYNLKETFTGINLYEKLVFIKRIMPLAAVPEIYGNTRLDITLSRELPGKLDILLSTIYRDLLINEQISLKTGLKLCDFSPGDSQALVDIFARVPFSSSHQQQILEMTEEIVFRDKCGLEEIFDRLGIQRLMEQERPQKEIIDALFQYRFPLYSGAAEKWQQEMKALNLPPHMKVTHYPFFEKKQLELTVQVQDVETLKRMVAALTSAGG